MNQSLLDYIAPPFVVRETPRFWHQRRSHHLAVDPGAMLKHMLDNIVPIAIPSERRHLGRELGHYTVQLLRAAVLHQA
eukprot:CAMPEP_0170424914 /NCGR_PEP_ID=MMETSP0117_2-20130122/37812_1 /TAXON_ID=400756 /ORGANISM="Durinskia baltica, Strain CSIRO CS-38" /LENGTH=77 /DNA_ID=CAMNT_0010683815 /DNA_START=255 /DNA_END=484 /DNA_ORIENTATION=+